MTEEKANRELKPQSHHSFGPSSMDMFDKCPMAYHLGKDLPSVGSAASEEGTKYHEETASVLMSFVGPDGFVKSRPTEEDVACMRDSFSVAAVTALSRFVRCIDGMYGEDGWKPFELHLEERLELSLADATHGDVFGGSPVFGTSDAVAVFDDRILVIDWKFGQSEPPRADESLQTAAYAVAASDRFGIKDVTAVIINPFHQFDYTGDAYRFDADGLEKAREIIRDVAERCVYGPWKANTGAHCTYCRANQHGVCGAIKGEVSTTCASFPAAADGISKAVEAMDDEELSTWKTKTDILKTITSAIDDEMRRRCLASEGGACGWYSVTARSGGKKIDDVAGAFKVASEVMTPKEYLAACSISVPKLKDAWAAACKASGVFKTKKDALADFDLTFDGYLEDKPPVYILKRTVK